MQNRRRDVGAVEAAIHFRCDYGCRVCGAACPADAIGIEQGEVVVDRHACTRCLVCVQLCPAQVIRRDAFA